MKRREFVVAAVGQAAALSTLAATAAGPASTPGQSWLRPPSLRGMLPVRQFVPAKMPLSAERVVHPRPDGETHMRAYHRNAHVGLRYELPIVVQGGAWPFVYELLTAPAGATLGTVHEAPDYGILRWTPTQDGAFAFSLRVTDQDGNSVVVDWSGQVGTNWIRFIDAVNGDDASGDGSLAAPWRTLSHGHAHTSGGRCLCLRAGTYAANASSMSMSTSLFATLIGWPDELPTIDCNSLTSENFAWHNGGDNFVGMLRFTGGAANVGNPRYFISLNVNHRCYHYRLTFDGPPAGTTNGGGDDNNSCLFLGAGGSQRRHVAQTHCTFHNLRRTSNGFSGIDTYQCRYLVVADNIYDTPFAGTGPRMALWIKGGEHEDVSVRGNRWLQAWSGDSLINLYMARAGQHGQFAARNIELCYNTVVSNNSTGWSSLAVQIGMAGQDGDRGPIWVYRNTVRGIVAIDKRDWPLTISFEYDIIVNDASVFGGTTSSKVMMLDNNDPTDRFRDPALRPNINLSVAGTECHGGGSDGILDAEQRLQGTWRDQYLGTHGAEVAVGDLIFRNGFEGGV